MRWAGAMRFGWAAMVLRAGLCVGAVTLSLGARPAQAASPLVAASETEVNIDGGFMHEQYHENLAVGDDESGYMPGFGVGISALVPAYPGRPLSPDIYADIGYDFNAGDIKYAGHYQTGQPVDLIDNAVMNRIEARLGVGLPLLSGDEIIVFAAGGYQAWNRNVNQKGVVESDEFYSTGLFGGGLKLDVPIANTIVASLTGEVLGLAGGGVNANGTDFGRGFGVTPEERVQLGLDEAFRPRIHMFANAFLQHFNYSGTHPEYFTDYYVFEPFSTTTQFGANVGIGYSFN